MAKTLTITDEKVKAGAARCADAKAVLKEMFPEAFSKVVDLSKLHPAGTYGGRDVSKLDVSLSKVREAFDLNNNLGNNFIQARTSGNYANKAFYLSPEFSWVIVRDNTGQLVLVPTAQRD